MSQLGRIGGQALSDNLLRAGVDLAFETSLLYLDVNNRRIGIRNTSPIFDLDVNGTIRTTNLTVDGQISVGNIRIVAPETFTTVVGGIDVFIGGSEIFHDRLITDNLVFDGNLISSSNNSNIVLDPNGTGRVELLASTNITGNLGVTGNINMSGNLTGLGTLTIGDQIIDTVTVNTDFTQSIVPGSDITYDLGRNAPTVRRWAELRTPDWTNISTGAWPGSGLRPQSITISDQLRLNGVNNTIFATQSSENILLNPDTGITYIEKIKWQDNDITNLNNNALTLVSTGIGYIRVVGTNAMVVPSGTDSERRDFPELGETRWNTDQGYLECFDGTVWTVSTGGGEEVTQEVMDDLGNAYVLILG